MEFAGKNVFITGGASGVGKTLAEEFAKEGANVYVGDLNADAVAQYNEDFAGHGKGYVLDVSNYEMVEAVAGQAFSDAGRIDILINCAGVINKVTPLDKLRMSSFDLCVDVNLKGCFYTSFAFGNRMRSTGGGRVISMCTSVAFNGDKGMLPYAVSKIGITTMTRNMAYEWSGDGVTFAALAPSFIGAGMNARAVQNPDFVEYMCKQNPMGELMSVEPIRDLIFFLASDKSKFINGETIVIDGGMYGYAPAGFMDFIAAKKAQAQP